MKKAIFFDLDGTLTDSGEGIINCAAMTLERFGLPVPSRQEMGVFVGPPLDKTFIEFGIPADKTDEAIRIFRSRYVTVGKFENFPYPGIPELLKSLQDAGHRLFVATSKPEVTALEVLEHFDLSKYFEKICGATLDGTRSHKEDVLRFLLSQVDGVENTVMVGDTKYDVIGAKHHNIPCIGVAWGYGKVQDMVDAGAIAIAKDVPHLYDLLRA